MRHLHGVFSHCATNSVGIRQSCSRSPWPAVLASLEISPASSRFPKHDRSVSTPPQQSKIRANQHRAQPRSACPRSQSRNPSEMYRTVPRWSRSACCFEILNRVCSSDAYLEGSDGVALPNVIGVPQSSHVDSMRGHVEERSN